MARVRNGVVTKRRHKKILKEASLPIGVFGVPLAIIGKIRKVVLKQESAWQKTKRLVKIIFVASLFLILLIIFISLKINGDL